MQESKRTRAPSGDLSRYGRELFESAGFSHGIYRKGSGPAVIVLAELPGITPRVLGFADRLVEAGCTAVLPDLFGVAGREPLAGGTLRGGARDAATVVRACISREFTVFALGQSSPVVAWLRELAAREHARCGGPGVGAIGMCFTGGFALAMATHPSVIAPVLAQPSLPLGLSARHRGAIDCSAEELQCVAARCASEGLRALGVHFHDDPMSPDERFRFLKQRLGDAFMMSELPQSSRHPEARLRHAHSVLTEDLIDEPGECTRAALDRVLAFFRQRLLGEAAQVEA
jgi:dienelactone hydrolase